jgi:hypothetical protein
VLLKKGCKSLVFQDIYRLVLLGAKNLNFTKRIWFEISRNNTFTFAIIALTFGLSWHEINQLDGVPLNHVPLRGL